MQLRLAAAVTGLILLVLFTFIWRPPQANPAADVPADLVEDAGPELILAPPPEDLSAPGSVRKTDRLIQPAVGSTLSPNVETPPPARPLPQAGSTTKPRPLPNPVRAPGSKPPHPADAGSAVVSRRPPAIRPLPVVPEAASVARKPGARAESTTIVLGPAVGRSTTPAPSAVMLAKFIAVSPDGLQLAVGDTGTDIRLIDVATRSVTRTIKIDARAALVDILYTPDGALLASTTGHQLLLFDPVTGDIARRYKTGETWTAFALMPGGEHIITTSLTGRVARVSLTTGDVVTVGEHGRPVSALAISPDARHAATGSSDGSLRLWSLEPLGAAPNVTDATAMNIQSLAFTSDSRQLAAAGSSTSIKMWSLGPQGLTQERIIKTLPGTISLQFGRDPRHLYVASQATFTYVRHIDTQASAVTQLTDGNSPTTVRDMAMSSDGQTIATLYRDRSVHVVTLDPETSTVQKQFTITAARNP